MSQTATELEMTDKVDPLLAWLKSSGRCGMHGASVLEVGSYNGRNTWQLVRAGANVTCIEPRPDNCDAWHRTMVEALAQGWSGSAKMLPGGGTVEVAFDMLGTFDLVFHSGVLYHLPDPYRHLRILSALAPRLFLNTHYADDTGSANLTVHDGFAGRWATEHTKNLRAGLSPRSFWFTRSALTRALREAGYDDVQVVTERREANGMRIGLWCEVST